MSKSCILTVTQGDFLYIQEWIEHHHNIGVDLFLIGYNGKEEDFNKLPKYDYVKYFDFSLNSNPIHYKLDVSKVGFFSRWESKENFKKRDLAPQTGMLNTLLHCVKYIYTNIDYTIVIDTDEFINIKNGTNNINEFLDEHFPKTNSSIQLKMCFYNTENIYYEDKPCQERFTNGFFLKNGRENDAGCHKIIINNNHNDFMRINIESPHTCTLYINGFRLNPDAIELKHFFTKTLEEWISKFNFDIDKDYFRRHRGIIIQSFFRDKNGNIFNEMTEEKMKAIPQLLKKYNVNYDPSTEELKDEIREYYKKCNNL
jgi:hypothetical protein